MERGTGPPVGLIVAPILLCVLIAALIFLWIKYREHKKRIQEQVLERMLRRNQDKPLLSTSACQSDEPVHSPESASESVVFTDEQSEKGQLDPIEERDDNPDTRLRSARPVQAAAPRQRMVPQEEPPEPVEDQETPPSYPFQQYNQVHPYANPGPTDDLNASEDQNNPSESGGEPEEEEPETFRERRYDSGYRSYRQRPYYRDMYDFQSLSGRQPHLLAEQNDSDESGKRLQNNVQEDSEDDSFAKKYIV